MDEYLAKSKTSGDIYRLLYYGESSSRQDISQALEISLPTTTRCLNSLCNAGLVKSAGESQSTGGRKATLYEYVPQARYAAGIDITRNHLSIVLVDLGLNILDTRRLRIPFEASDQYFSTLAREYEDMISQKLPDRSCLLGTGISVPVLLGDDHKTINYATVIPLPFNIYSILSSYIHEPFLFFNDSNSAGLAESWRGHYTSSLIYLSLSSSVGGAYINERTLYTGDHNRGCEFGHMALIPHGKKCYCGSYGCLDAYCTANALTDFTDGNLKEFFDILKTGANQGIRNVFDSYLDYLAIAVNNLRMCFDCDIILGGNVGAYMADYLDLFRKKAIKLNPFENDGSFIHACHYRTEASAVGAAIYYIDQFVKNFPYEM